MEIRQKILTHGIYEKILGEIGVKFQKTNGTEALQ